jgi:hypothetical protein
MVTPTFKFNRSIYRWQHALDGWKLMRSGRVVDEFVRDLRYPSMFRRRGRNADRPWLRKVRVWCFVPDGRNAVYPDDAFVCGQIEATCDGESGVDGDLVAASLTEVKKLLD